MTEMNALVLPELNDLNRFFWTGGADGKLRFQRCGDCGHWLHPPGVSCPECLSRNLSVETVSGNGTIEALTVNYQQWGADKTEPYAVAIVGLDEQSGLNLTTNIVGCDLDSVYIGQRVEVTFRAQEDVFLPLFTPI